MRNGLPALGVKHIDACRTRVEQAMRVVAHPRLERAEGRAQDELERRAHAGAAAERGGDVAPPAGPGVDEGLSGPARPVAPAANGDAEDDAWRDLLRAPMMEVPATPIADDANDMRDDGHDDDGDGMLMRVGGPAAIAELYSPPRVTAALGLAPVGGELAAGSTFDLHADAYGVRWDFSKPADRKRAFDRIREE